MTQRSYTIAFGDLEISVSSAQSITPERQAPVPKLTGHEMSLLKTMKNASEKARNKRRVIVDDFESRKDEEVVAPVLIGEPVEAQKPECLPIPASQIQYLNEFTSSVCEDAKFSSDNKPTEESTLPASVMCILESDETKKSRENSVPVWSVHSAESKSSHIKEFFCKNPSNAASSVLCWFCSHSMTLSEFRCFPKFMPFQYREQTRHFIVKGYFCSWVRHSHATDPPFSNVNCAGVCSRLLFVRRTE